MLHRERGEGRATLGKNREGSCWGESPKERSRKNQVGGREAPHRQTSDTGRIPGGTQAPSPVWGHVIEASQVTGGRGEENAAQGLVWVTVLCAAFSS